MTKVVQLSHAVATSASGVEYRVPYRRCRVRGAQLALYYQINAASTGFFGWWAACIVGQYEASTISLGGSTATGRESQAIAFVRRYTQQATANPNALYDFNQFFPDLGIEIGQNQILTWYLAGQAMVALTGECFLYLDILQ